MTRDPIRERWRDRTRRIISGGAAGAEESPLELAAGHLFRAAPPTRPRTPRAVASLLAELRERGPGGASGWRRTFGIRRLAIALSMFFSINLAMALTLSPVKQWWSRALQVNASPPVSRPAAVPSAPTIEIDPRLAEPSGDSARLEAPALPPPRPRVHAPVASRAVEIAPSPPAPIAAIPEPDGEALAGEAELLSRALGDLGEGRPAQALVKIASYHQRFPHGSLAYEAALAEVKAEMATGQDSRALAALGVAMALPGFDSWPRASELILLRAELQARAQDCNQALATFDRLLSSPELDPPLAERALYGRASCLAAQSDQAGSRRALQEYLRRFPGGRFAAAARTALGAQQAQ